ncbi:hypothetical protein M514_11195 [Trichuris suis]|uniref:Uncharacterized protein n=1 Tax=Trichuris suis TaxID=68888 RepID=A0A085LSF8_9BILA|nr:hypothetical protein M513_11195 [Trichuris suis]KFD67981.1 hypothetical protein M514_11195 [Trichuris suis]
MSESSGSINADEETDSAGIDCFSVAQEESANASQFGRASLPKVQPPPTPSRSSKRANVFPPP